MNIQKTKLSNYFPIISDREEVLTLIRENINYSNIYNSWPSYWQKTFIDFCTGERGIKLLYDVFFKEFFNPEASTEDLEELLSLLMGQDIKIVSVLPNDNTRICDENTLIITDIVVALHNGTIANVEIQKIGYLFPGQRTSCYSADLLLRQYKKAKSEYRNKFNYSCIKPVYTIVIFESSPAEILADDEHYIHNGRFTFDTSIELDHLQNIIYISLDNFKKSLQNGDIRNKLDAWLLFLSSDSPDDILSIIQKYPEFKERYNKLFVICKNMEKVMGLFSEELRIMDQNTVKLMIDQMTEENTRMSEEYAKVSEENTRMSEEYAKVSEENTKLKATVEEKDAIIAKLKEELEHAN